MNVRRVVLWSPAWADSGDRRPFTNRVSPLRTGRPEMRQRHRVPVVSLNRQRPTVDRHRACEGDDPRDRRQHRAPRGTSDVNTPVLAGRVRVVAELELLHHGPIGRPRPRCSGGREHEHGCDGSDQGPAHLGLLVFSIDNVQPPYRCGRTLSIWTTRTRRIGAGERALSGARRPRSPCVAGARPRRAPQLPPQPPRGQAAPPSPPDRQRA
jgi:hypothetical protein